MRKPKSDSKIEITRLGKDEVNLVEHPFAGLSSTPGAQVIENEWDTKHPVTGKTLTAKWRAAGDPQWGLPTATDERVYLVLMELTREAGFAQQVHFSRYDIIKRLGWSNHAQSYNILRDSLRRLNSVTITSENALWNPDVQAFVDEGFHLIESFRIVAGEVGRKSVASNALPPSYFIWSREIHDSFRHGQIRSIDLGFALSLKGAIALRLYRYLDKKAYDGKTTFEIELKRLCEMHLGMASATYTSTLKTRLQPAHDELQTRGFLGETAYEPMKTKKGEKVCYTFPRPKELKASSASAESSLPEATLPLPKPKSKRKLKPAPVPEMSDRSDTSAAAPQAPEDDLMQRMLGLKVSSSVALGLLETCSQDELVQQLDCLQDRDPRDPAATFVRAMRERWEVPAKYLERVEAQERAQKSQTAQVSAQTAKAAQKAAEGAQKASQDVEAARLDAEWESLDLQTREQIEQEAISRLGILGQMGRAKGALDAMRRSIQRERMK